MVLRRCRVETRVVVLRRCRVASEGKIIMAYGVCACTGCSKDGTKLCSQCGEEAYCSGECQKKAWTTGHKEQCRLATKPEVVTVTQRMEDLSLKQLRNVVIAKAAQYNSNKRAIILSILEHKDKDKAALLKLVTEHVQVSEIEPLLTGRGGENASSSSGGDGGASSARAGGKKVLVSRKDKVKAALEEHKMPSAEQLRRQAREMSRNPELVRRANPEMRKFTDAQIREHAKEMEKMATNPEMIQAMMKVQAMPEAERSALNQIQEGLAGKVPRDEKWIAETIRVVKAQPDTLKMLFQGRVGAESPMSEKQIMAIIDYVVTCSDWFLSSAVRFVNWGLRMRGPVGEMYRTVDAATFGCAQYLVLFVMLVILFYVGRMLWYLVTLVFGLVVGGYRMLTNGGSESANAAAGAAAADSSAAAADSPQEEAPFVEL